MLRKFELPVILMGLLLALSPSAALAREGREHGERGGGRSYSGRSFSGGRSYGGGNSFRGGGGNYYRGGGGGWRDGHEGRRDRDWDRGYRGYYGGGLGLGFGYYGAPGYYADPGYDYGPRYAGPGYCNPAGFYDQWGNFHYFAGCY